MSFDPNGSPGRVPAEEWLNVFALVTYIPAPLGEFLDQLRRELVPHDDPRAHVSLLPPRPLAGEWRQAWAEVRNTLRRRAAFEVELTGIRTFPVTDVIYLEVGAGAAELCDIHAQMNSNSLAFEEPFAYHPHVTLAQDISHQDVGGGAQAGRAALAGVPRPAQLPRRAGCVRAKHHQRPLARSGRIPACQHAR